MSVDSRINYSEIADDMKAIMSKKPDHDTLRNVASMLGDSAALLSSGCDYYGGYFLIAMLSTVLAELQKGAQSSTEEGKALIQNTCLTLMSGLGETLQ